MHRLPIAAAIVLTCLAASPALRAQPGELRVLAVHPARLELAAPRGTPVGVRFDRPLDPQSIGPDSLTLYGRFSGTVPGEVRVVGDTLRFLPVGPLPAGDWVTARVAPSVRGNGGQVLPHAHVWNFWAAAAPASLNLELEATLQPGSIPYGGHGGDLDHDGDLDLAIANEGSNDVTVYLNDGAGGYGPPVKYAAGSVPSPIEAADLDGDGHVDLAVANLSSADVSVYLGRGDGTFEPQARYGAGINPRGIGFIDLDRDGALDLVVTNRSSDDVSLLRNRGGGDFAPERRGDLPGDGETAVAVSDVNADGLEDLVVGFHDAQKVEVWRARPGGGFTRTSTAAAGGTVWQMAIGDLNGDGLLDAATANSSGNAGVLLATGPGVLADAVTYPTGAFPLAIDLGDLDGDGDLDLVTSNFFGGNYTFYRNDGAGGFGGRFDLPASETGSCAILHDRDGDGDLDVTAIDEEGDEVRLYRND